MAAPSLAAMPLLIKLNFFRAPVPTESIGINFAYYAFLGALVGSIARPFGGWMADKWGGAKVTFWTFVAMIVGTLTVIYTLTQLTPVPKPPPGAPAPDPATFEYKPEVVAAVNANSDIFPWFLLAFLFVFAASGIGNGSTFRTIGVIFDRTQAGPVLGWTSAIAAYGAFIAPVVIGAQIKAGTPQFAMYGFAVFYALCLILNWWFYLRPNAYVKNP